MGSYTHLKVSKEDAIRAIQNSLAFMDEEQLENILNSLKSQPLIIFNVGDETEEEAKSYLENLILGNYHDRN